MEDPRRLSVRHDAFLPYEIEGKAPSTNDYVENLSVTGAYLRTLEPLPVRTRLKVGIAAPKSGRRFAFDAEVMRVIEPERSPSEGLPPGMGIQFLDLGGGDPRPKAVEILNELAAVERERQQAVPAGQPAAELILEPENAEAVARLDQFLIQSRKQNYYEILALDAATTTAILVKKHYHRRAKEFHPDRFHRFRTPEIDAKVEEVYGLLTRAYETLRDPVKREGYDKQHGIRQTLDFRRAAAKARYDEASMSFTAGRVFGATVALKVALGLDPGNPDIQRKLDEVERVRKFFTT